MNPFEAFRFGAAPAAAAASPLKRPRSPAAPPAAALPRRDWAQPPAQWEEVYSRIVAARAGRTASVDEFHAFLLACRTEPSPAFQVLVASLLSVQCRDTVALAATLRLRAALGGAITPAAVHAAAPGCVEDAVATCNLRNAKARVNTAHAACTAASVRFDTSAVCPQARFVRGCAAALLSPRHGGEVPRDVATLQTLPGVGPKVARLVASVAFGDAGAGIVVDTHVHRVTNRLGWAAAPAPERTRQQLQAWLPAALWDEASLELLGFGQQVCTPVRPRCADCPVRDLCPSAHAAHPGDAAEPDF